MFDELVNSLSAEEYNAWVKILQDQQIAKEMQVELRQHKIALATQRIERAGIEGLGEMTMRVDPTSYHYWGQRLGYDCWSDEQFCREFRRDNETVRVRNRARKTTVVAGWEGNEATRQQGNEGLVDQFGRAL